MKIETTQSKPSNKDNILMTVWNMKKNDIAVWLCTLIVLGNIVAVIALSEVTHANLPPTAFVDGSGTVADPYIITNVWELQNMSTNLSAYYALGNDIDASITAGWNGGEGFEPVGAGTWNITDKHFTGSLNGRNYTITGLYIDRPGTDDQGLFGFVGAGGVVNNVGLVDNNITGNMRIGGLVGYLLEEGTVENSFVTGTMTGKYYVGGLIGANDGTVTSSYATGDVYGIGYFGGLVGNNGGKVADSYATGALMGTGFMGGLVGNNDGIVTDSYATGAVSGTDLRVGGLVGRNDKGMIFNSYATGSVNGKISVGGLVGYNNNTIYNSYATGAVAGSSIVGGLAGYNNNTISKSYAIGKVSGIWRVGGLIGWNHFGTVSDCYSVGYVWGEIDFGGLVGDNEGGIVSNCFWDTQTSGMATSDGGTGKTTAEMMMQSTFTDAGWDFDNIWRIEEGKTHPILSWQDEPISNPTNNTGLSNIQWAVIIVAAAIFAVILAVLLMRRKSKPAAAEPPQAAEPQPGPEEIGREEKHEG